MAARVGCGNCPPVRAFHSDRYEIPLPPGHRFPIEKYRRLRELLLERAILTADELAPAPLATRSELETVHTPAYLDAVFAGTLDAQMQRRIGLPWSEALVLRSRASVGGTLAAARWALEHGIAGNLAGGTHHAFADRGEGYCVFNDLAVAARVLQREGRARRIVIVDLDVHQGNGTADIFFGDPTVFTFSMHGEKNFPFKKTVSTLDVNLPDGCTDEEYLRRLSKHLPEVLDEGSPDLLLYQAGVDPLAEDSLGRLSLTWGGLRARDRLVLEAARERHVPVVLTMGGGYAKPIDFSLEAHANTYALAKLLYEG
ncbi:MAG: histone deacetylase [Myxococcales bacterium]